MAQTKVVRVEDLDHQVSRKESKFNLLPGDFPEVPSGKNFLSPDGKDIDGPVYGASADDIDSEARDEVHSLPSGWPRLAKLLQRCSWDFTTAVSPSINKAVSHLELLQTILEELWQEEDVASSKSRSQSAATHTTHRSRASAASSGKKQLHFHSDVDSVPSTAHKMSASQSAASKRSTSATSSGTQLLILGQGGRTNEGSVPADHVTSHSEHESPEVPFMGIEDVTEEVILLLARLETDRQETLKNLHKERERVKMLKSKINDLAEKRMKELPVAVQKEHEACALDIMELNWHVSNRSRLEARIKGRVEVAQDLNTDLKDNLAFITSHIPLVQEKLDLEQDAMARIRQAQTDTDDELQTTQERCDSVIRKSEDAHLKAAQERECIKADLDTINRDLEKISEELAKARTTHASYVEQCEKNQAQVETNEQELIVLEVKCENAKTAEGLTAARVLSLESKIKKAEFEQGRLQHENSKVEEELKKTTAAYQQIEKDLREAIDLKKEKLKRFTRDNQELEMDIGDIQDKIKKCDRQKTADEKNIDRMKKELERTKNLIQVSNEDLASVSIINNATREKLRTQEEKCLQTEEALKATMEALRKQMKEEQHTKTVMAARITSDSAELTKLQDESIAKKANVDSMADEVQQALDLVLDKVLKLRSSHAEKMKVCKDMKAELETLEKARKDLQDSMEAKKVELQPELDELKPLEEQRRIMASLRNEMLEVDRKLDHMAWKSELINKKLDDMDASSHMVTKAFDTTERAIKKLEQDLEEVQLQIEASRHIEDNLTISLNNLLSRMKDRQKAHSDLMKERRETAERLHNELKTELAKNTHLASDYRRIQNEHFFIKSNMLDKYDERVKVENTIKDARQLSALQKRLHNAMLIYFKYRHLYTDSELERLETDSSINGVKVCQLQNQMDAALEKITDFLQNQLNGEAIRKAALEKVAQEEREEEKALQAVVTPAKKASVSRMSQPSRTKSVLSSNPSAVVAH